MGPISAWERMHEVRDYLSRTRHCRRASLGIKAVSPPAEDRQCAVGNKLRRAYRTTDYELSVSKTDYILIYILI